MTKYPISIGKSPRFKQQSGIYFLSNNNNNNNNNDYDHNSYYEYDDDDDMSLASDDATGDDSVATLVAAAAATANNDTFAAASTTTTTTTSSPTTTTNLLLSTPPRGTTTTTTMAMDIAPASSTTLLPRQQQQRRRDTSMMELTPPRQRYVNNNNDVVVFGGEGETTEILIHLEAFGITTGPISIPLDVVLLRQPPRVMATTKGRRRRRHQHHQQRDVVVLKKFWYNDLLDFLAQQISQLRMNWTTEWERIPKILSKLPLLLLCSSTTNTGIVTTTRIEPYPGGNPEALQQALATASSSYAAATGTGGGMAAASSSVELRFDCEPNRLYYHPNFDGWNFDHVSLNPFPHDVQAMFGRNERNIDYILEHMKQRRHDTSFQALACDAILQLRPSSAGGVYDDLGSTTKERSLNSIRLTKSIISTWHKHCNHGNGNGRCSSESNSTNLARKAFLALCHMGQYGGLPCRSLLIQLNRIQSIVLGTMKSPGVFQNDPILQQAGLSFLKVLARTTFDPEEQDANDAIVSLFQDESTMDIILTTMMNHLSSQQVLETGLKLLLALVGGDENSTTTTDNKDKEEEQQSMVEGVVVCWAGSVVYICDQARTYFGLEHKILVPLMDRVMQAIGKCSCVVGGGLSIDAVMEASRSMMASSTSNSTNGVDNVAQIMNRLGSSMKEYPNNRCLQEMGCFLLAQVGRHRHTSSNQGLTSHALEIVAMSMKTQSNSPALQALACEIIADATTSATTSETASLKSCTQVTLECVASALSRFVGTWCVASHALKALQGMARTLSDLPTNFVCESNVVGAILSLMEERLNDLDLQKACSEVLLRLDYSDESLAMALAKPLVLEEGRHLQGGRRAAITNARGVRILFLVMQRHCYDETMMEYGVQLLAAMTGYWDADVMDALVELEANSFLLETTNAYPNNRTISIHGTNVGALVVDCKKKLEEFELRGGLDVDEEYHRVRLGAARPSSLEAPMPCDE